MKRLASLAGMLLLAACASLPGGGGPAGGRGAGLRPVANPTAVVAADLAFARLAGEVGQWEAFRRTATEDALMFAPGPVNAQAWLRTQAEPAEAASWWPERAISSCDGSLAVTIGAASWPDGSASRYLTVWQRQRDGGYKWVLDTGDPLPVAPQRPDFVQTIIADCSPAPSSAKPVSTGTRRVAADDRTLHFEVATPAGQAGELVVLYWDDGAFQPLYRRSLPSAPAQ